MIRKLAGKTVFITGASRGIGKQIALKVAEDGANVVIAAKTTEAHPKLPGTIYSAAEEVEAAGGKALPVQCDLRDEQNVKNAIDEAVKKFGGIDILVNNASAISLTGTLQTEMKRYDLMHSINTRGTFMTSKYCIPHLLKGSNPHILNLSPPLVMNPRWFKDHVAYTMAKYGMSMCVLGMAAELAPHGIAVNALWPRTAVWTAAMKMLGGGDDVAKNCRKPEVLSDAAYAILTKDSRSFTGNFCIDEEVLKAEGVTDMDKYAVAPGNPLMPDFFLPDEMIKGFDIEVTPAGAHQAQAEATPSSTGSKAERIFTAMEGILTDDMRSELNACLSFQVSGQNWYIDASTARPLKVAKGEADTKPDVTFICDDDTFAQIASGELKATNAFMGGKLKVKGNLALAMKAEKLFGKMKSKL